MLARLFAERGFQVLVVSCRGTFGSGGEWEAFFHEREDGLAVLDWALEQPWASQEVGLYGASYVGFTQWAVAGEVPPQVRAMAPTVTSANFRELFYPGEAYALESSLTWISGLDVQHLPFPVRLLAGRRTGRIYPSAVLASPLGSTDRALVGRQSSDFQDWTAHEEPDDPYWKPIDFRQDLRRVPPASLVAGWYDIFCASQLADHAALLEAGRPVRLTVGPWTHAAPGGIATLVRETFLWMSQHLDGAARQPALPPGARIFVLGAKRWVQLPEWPPPCTPTAWHLQPGGGLATTAAPESAPDRYRYDPADPTPSAGGGSLRGPSAGPKDNAVREARADVLTYTTPALTEDLTVMGAVRMRVHVRSSARSTDLVVRLCDVDPKGRSTNLTDGVRRLGPDDLEGAEEGGDGVTAVDLELTPTAATFLAGHRIRVQVSSGAHPLYARNPGSGEPLATATTFVVADQEVFHDPAHESWIELPVVAPVRATTLGERWRQRHG